MHAHNVLIAQGVMDVLAGYSGPECLDDKAFIRIFYVCVGCGEPLYGAPEWFTLSLYHQP